MTDSYDVNEQTDRAFEVSVYSQDWEPAGFEVGNWDGSREVTTFDIGNDHPWDSQTEYFDADDVSYASETRLQDGTVVTRGRATQNSGTIDDDIISGGDGNDELGGSSGDDTLTEGEWVTTVRRAPGAAELAGGQIGTVLGSSIGQSLAGDDPFAQVAAGTALGAVLQNVGEAFGRSLNQGVDLATAAYDVFDNFDADLGSAFRSAGIGAVSSFLTAELAEGLGVDTSDFGGALFSYAASTGISSILDLALDNIGAGLEISSDFGGALFNGTGIGFSPAGVAGFVGRYLAHQIVAPENIGGSIGSTLGGFGGSVIGAGLTGLGGAVLGTIGNGVLTAVGMQAAIGAVSGLLGIATFGISILIGTLIGTLLGNAIGGLLGTDEGWGYGTAEVDPATGLFVNASHASDDADFGNPASNTKLAALEIINQFVEATGGTIANENAQLYILFQGDSHGGRWMRATVSGAGVDGNEFSASNTWSNHNVVEQMISYAVINMLKNLDIAGGNLYVKRAIAGTTATTLDQLAGEIKIAEDFGRYLADSDVIDALIRLNPDSAFAAGWLITLLRAEELGLDQMGGTDFIGGIASFLKGFGLDRYGAGYGDVAVSLAGTTLVLTIEQGEGIEPRIIEIEDFAELTGLAHLQSSAAQITDYEDAPGVTPDFGDFAGGLGAGTVYGTDGDDLWFANDSGQAFADQSVSLDTQSNDVAIGGAGDDTIVAGVGMDLIQGGAGNDLIDGGSGDDIIIGGSGDDTIEGGLGNDVYAFGRGDGADTISDHGHQTTRLRPRSATRQIGTEIVSTDYVGVWSDFDDYGNGQWVPYYDDDGNMYVWNDGWASTDDYGGEVGGGTIYAPVSIDRTVPIYEDYVAYDTIISGSAEEIDAGFDVVQFGDGISRGDLIMRMVGDDLIIAVRDPAQADQAFGDTSDRLVLRNWALENERIEALALADGAILDVMDILAAMDDFGTLTDMSGQRPDGSAWSLQREVTAAGDVVRLAFVNEDSTTTEHEFIDGVLRSTVHNDPENVYNTGILGGAISNLAGLLGASAATDAGPWSTITTNYDATGTADNELVTYDDGSTSYTDWDQADAAAWAQTTSNYSSDGQLTSRTQVYDNALVWDYTFVAGVLSQATATDGDDAYGWSHLTNTYDAAGELTSQSGVQDDTTTWNHTYVDGARTSTVLADSGNENAWSEISTNYNGVGIADNQRTTNDDGTSSYTDWDLVEAHNWSQITTHYDAAGQKVSQDGTYDNTRTWHYEFENGVLRSSTAGDPGDIAGWSEITTTFNADRQIASQAGTYDNGSTWRHTYEDGALRSTVRGDPNDVYGWSEITTNYDAARNIDSQRTTSNDGTSSYTDWDLEDVHSWSQITTHYDAAGQKVSQDGTYDNTRTWHYEFENGVLRSSTAGDPNNIVGWSEITTYFNAARQVIAQTGSFDDGRGWSTTWDADDQYDWSMQRTHYDASGAAYWQSGKNDDGSTWSNAYAAPVALDLDGDGLQPISRFASTARFDMDGDGTREQTAWVAPGDGLLAIDIGNDGVIDQTREIVFTEWAPGSTSDMAALRAVFDSNENGALDTGDARWAEFRIWSDLNQDGVSQSGEVMSLDALGINGIGLDPEGSGVTLADGTTIQGLSTYSRTDGTSGIAGDMTFAYAADGTALSDADSFAVASTQLISAMAGFGALNGIGSLAPEQEATAAQVSLVGPAHLQHGSGAP